MNVRHLTCACGAAVVVAIAVGACGGGSIDVVARVAGVAITRTDLDHWIAVEDGLAPGNTSGKRVVEARALSFLISEQWTLGEGRELGLTVSERRARRETEVLNYERRAGIAFGDVPRAAKRMQVVGSRATEADQVRVVKLELLEAEIQQARTVLAAQGIGHTQVVAYYTRHKRHFLVPEHRKVVVIETPRLGPTLKAKREIESGKDPARVARHVSQGPLAHLGGALQDLVGRRGMRGEGLVANIFRARPRLLVGPLRGDWYYIFEVLHVSPAHEPGLARVEDRIVEYLAGRQASTATRAAEERRWAARTVCAQGYARGCGHGGGGLA